MRARPVLISTARVVGSLALVLGLSWSVMRFMYDDEQPRVQASEGIAAASAVMDSISSFYADHHHLPGPADIEEYSFGVHPHVADARVMPDSRIIVTYKGRREIDGKRLTLTPEVDAKGELKWHCVSPDIDARWWPDFCRPKQS